MLTTLGLAGGRTSPAADWSQTLEAGLNTAYDTNPQLQPGSHVTDESAQLTVDGNSTTQGEISQLNVTPRFSIIRYAHETSLDIETGSIDLAYQSKLERGQWSFTGEALTDSTVTSELGSTGITDINRRHYAYTASLGYQYALSERLGWTMQGSWQDTRYSDAWRFGLTDYQYGSLQFGPTWNLTDRLVGSLILETDQIDPQTGTRQEDYSASLQVKRTMNEKYAWRISGGATWVNSGTGPYSKSTSEVFEVGATRLGEFVQWDVSVRRAVLPIGLGLLARQEQASLTMSASTSEHSTLNLTVSALRTDPVSLFVYINPEISLNYLVYGGASFGFASAEWRYNLSPRWSVAAAYVESRARNNTIGGWADGNQARLSIVWQSARL
jgi:hypothetical protein